MLNVQNLITKNRLRKQIHNPKETNPPIRSSEKKIKYVNDPEIIGICLTNDYEKKSQFISRTIVIYTLINIQKKKDRLRDHKRYVKYKTVISE